MSDTEFIRQQGESLRILLSAQAKEKQIREAQEKKEAPEPIVEKKQIKRSKSDGSK